MTLSEDPRIERVAKALFEQAVSRAQAEVDAIEFDVSEMPSVFERLMIESETAQVLVFGSYLEDRITTLIKTHLKHLESKTAESALFGGTGPLATFSGRTLLAYHLGWMTSDTKRKLDCFRKIRNEFAHRAFKASFTDASIKSLFQEIEYNPERMVEVIGEAISDAEERLIVISAAELTVEKRSLCNLAFLAEHVFRELVTLPVAMANHVPPGAVCSGDLDEGPQLIKRLYLSFAASLLVIIKRASVSLGADQDEGKNDH